MCRRRALLVVAAIGFGCAHAEPQAHVAEKLNARRGLRADFERRPDEPAEVPAGVDVHDGLGRDEAAAIALWNSPALRADLARVATAEADLIAARRPRNPSLRFMPAVGPMQLYLWFAWPLESFITMPKRIELAKANMEAVSASVVQTGLDLIRDVELAHVDWVLAHDRVEVRRQIAEGLVEMADIAEARAELGDAPLSDVDAARGDALVAQDELARAEDDAAIAAARLYARMGWKPTGDLRPEEETSRVPNAEGMDVESIATTSRPDLLSAQQAIEVAGARIGLEKLAVLKISGIVYGRGGAGGPTGVQAGPEVELPIFDQNQGGIARAKGELEAAIWRYHDLRNQVVADVTEAQTRLRQASRSLGAYRETIVAARQRELAAAAAQFELGEQSYVPVLVATGRLETARMREVELAADVDRAVTLLERAVGRRLTPMPEETP